jgi:hypothetical protein
VLDAPQRIIISAKKNKKIKITAKANLCLRL